MPHPGQPPDHVLDLFVAEGVLEPLPGGRGTTWRAGDLALSPGHDGSEAWLAPVQARLAVRLDEGSPRSLRLALPVPARDGSLVVDGWSATRFEPGTTPCRDLPTLRATAHLLHAHLATAVPERPPGWTPSATGGRRPSGRRTTPGSRSRRLPGAPSPGSPTSSRDSSAGWTTPTTPTSAASSSCTATSPATCCSTRPACRS
ncbi:hypothetical protein [Nocardioides okcheonensis]|uniref:hypothetical protein n=1 Tax=Nocardioides okcheonensis TaxID=2894081 RepID=UPI001E41218F|nr:hypothetical protein [Nocardioides okcheonensis]UFN45420.1 hypothetical protein LN652_04210 [Nocardioides okcheonensis]